MQRVAEASSSLKAKELCGDSLGLFGVLLLMEEILHQLIGSLSHVFKGLYIPGGAGSLSSTV